MVKSPTCQRDSDLEDRLLDTAGAGEGGRDSESRAGMCTCPQIQWTAEEVAAVSYRSSSSPALCDNREG